MAELFMTTNEDRMIETHPLRTKPKPAPGVDEPRSLIDTSKMSAGQRAALELTEAARETALEPSFVSGLFMGSLELPQRFPVQTAEDRDQGDAFLQKLEKMLHERVDPDEIDGNGELPA